MDIDKTVIKKINGNCAENFLILSAYDNFRLELGFDNQKNMSLNFFCGKGLTFDEICDLAEECHVKKSVPPPAYIDGDFFKKWNDNGKSSEIIYSPPAKIKEQIEKIYQLDYFSMQRQTVGRITGCCSGSNIDKLSEQFILFTADGRLFGIFKFIHSSKSYEVMRLWNSTYKYSKIHWGPMNKLFLIKEFEISDGKTDENEITDFFSSVPEKFKKIYLKIR